MGGPKGGGPKVGNPKFPTFLTSPALNFHLFLSLSGWSSRGILVVFEAPGPERETKRAKNSGGPAEGGPDREVLRRRVRAGGPAEGDPAEGGRSSRGNEKKTNFKKS